MARTDIYKCSFFPETIRDFYDLPASLMSTAEGAEDCVARFTSLTSESDLSAVSPGEWMAVIRITSSDSDSVMKVIAVSIELSIVNGLINSGHYAIEAWLNLEFSTHTKKIGWAIKTIYKKHIRRNLNEGFELFCCLCGDHGRGQSIP